MPLRAWCDTRPSFLNFFGAHLPQLFGRLKTLNEPSRVMSARAAAAPALQSHPNAEVNIMRPMPATGQHTVACWWMEVNKCAAGETHRLERACWGLRRSCPWAAFTCPAHIPLAPSGCSSHIHPHRDRTGASSRAARCGDTGRRRSAAGRRTDSSRSHKPNSALASARR